jgi:hypothetical protein
VRPLPQHRIPHPAHTEVGEKVEVA